MDKIKIKDLEVYCYHGVFPEENKLGQKFVISAELYLDTHKAGISDDLSESIHYGEVCYMIERFMKNNTFKLLESVAERLADYLLLEISLLEKIKLEIKKPWAPIGLPLTYASVEIKREWIDVYLGVGSNMGDKHQYINKAIEQLKQDSKVKVIQVSKLIKTKPYGGVEQDDFINGCIFIKTLLSPLELLYNLNQIEASLERVREIRWGARTIDLDILLFGEQIIYQSNLIIPHIDMCNREFVLGPLTEIAPYVIHPVLKEPIYLLNKELLNKL
jgi:dihydroneopterin aldolase/2-amino-4-hydroxy-6-hydroxymethyldihydropteridine pyrophosphokinase